MGTLKKTSWGWMNSLIAFLAVSLLLLGCVGLCHKRSRDSIEHAKENGYLSKAELVNMAVSAFRDHYGANAGRFIVKYDKGNKTWNEYYAQFFPELKGVDYQAIVVNRTGELSPGGGPFWVCIDKKTGEVLVTDAGR